ncbi:hypothetical protein KKF91_17350 [Myxococcota bacterium]|nr:hypothetical protein [Myxococcota bacterium]
MNTSRALALLCALLIPASLHALSPPARRATLGMVAADNPLASEAGARAGRGRRRRRRRRGRRLDARRRPPLRLRPRRRRLRRPLPRRRGGPRPGFP